MNIELLNTMTTKASSGGFVISLDFELMWGVRDQVTIAQYGPNVLGVRQAIPSLLELFGRKQIACTWATVGLLFFDHKDDLEIALPKVRPQYRNQKLSPYPDISRLGRTESDDPYHFGLSLIRQIAATPNQEVATHTFSHYYCLEEGQTLEAFEADLQAAIAAARAPHAKMACKGSKMQFRR